MLKKTNCWLIGLLILSCSHCYAVQSTDFELKHFFPSNLKDLEKHVEFSPKTLAKFNKLRRDHDSRRAEILQMWEMPKQDRVQLEDELTAMNLQKLESLLNDEQRVALEKYFAFHSIIPRAQTTREHQAKWFALFFDKKFQKLLDIKDSQNKELAKIKSQLTNRYNKSTEEFFKEEKRIIKSNNAEAKKFVSEIEFALLKEIAIPTFDFTTKTQRKALRDCKRLRGGNKTADSFGLSGKFNLRQLSPLIAIMPGKSIETRVNPLAAIVLLNEDSVASDLDLSETQKAAIAKLHTTYMKGAKEEFRWSPIFEEKVEEAEVFSACSPINKILIEEQLLRFQKIYRTFQVKAFGCDIILAHPDIQRKLKLDTKTKAKLKSIDNAFRQDQKVLSDKTNNSFNFEIIKSANKAFSTLSSDQKQKWKELTGKFGEFPIPSKQN